MLSDGADGEAKGANYSKKRMAKEFADKDKRQMQAKKAAKSERRECCIKGTKGPDKKRQNPQGATGFVEKGEKRRYSFQ